MTSMQCYQTVEETRSQVSYPPMTNQGQTQYCGTTHASHGTNHCQDKNKNHGHGMTHTHPSNGHGHGLMTHIHSSNGHGHGFMTHAHSSNGHGHGSSMTHCTSQNCAPNNGTTCHGRTKKKGLFQRIKDSLDGHSSDSSDSESDDDRRGKTRTMKC